MPTDHAPLQFLDCCHLREELEGAPMTNPLGRAFVGVPWEPPNAEVLDAPEGTRFA
jgi:hypothetical protein